MEDDIRHLLERYENEITELSAKTNGELTDEMALYVDIVSSLNVILQNYEGADE